MRAMPICQRGPGSPAVGLFHFQVEALVLGLAVADFTFQMVVALTS